MFDQTYTARKRQAAVTALASPRHPTAATQWSRLLLVDIICSVWDTPYNALSMGMTQQFSCFCPR